MPKLPRISARECIAALQKIGFVVVRQLGSHVILRRETPFAQTTVPNHQELALGTLRRILRDTGVSVEAFIDLL